MARLEQLRSSNVVADLAFYAYRDLNRTEPWPFLLAALKRNPVAIAGANGMSDADVLRVVSEMPDESIYDEHGRLAQPDEVWNYGRGDGVEKAILLANILHHRSPDTALGLAVSPDSARLVAPGATYEFASRKGLRAQTWPLTEWLNASS